jgi:hypothetical protein
MGIARDHQMETFPSDVCAGHQWQNCVGWSLSTSTSEVVFTPGPAMCGIGPTGRAARSARRLAYRGTRRGCRNASGALNTLASHPLAALRGGSRSACRHPGGGEPAKPHGLRNWDARAISQVNSSGDPARTVAFITKGGLHLDTPEMTSRRRTSSTPRQFGSSHVQAGR